MNKPSKKEINHLIKMIARYNKTLWDVICMAEEITRTEGFEYIRSLDEESEEDIETLKDLATRFSKYTKKTAINGSFVDFELNSATLQEVKDVTDMIEELLGDVHA